MRIIKLALVILDLLVVVIYCKEFSRAYVSVMVCLMITLSGHWYGDVLVSIVLVGLLLGTADKDFYV